MKNYIFCFLLLFYFSGAISSGTINDGSASFEWLTTTFEDDPGEYILVSETAGPEIGYQYWFYYRTSTDTREFALPDPDSEDFTGNVATLTWNNVADKGFSVQVILTLTDYPGISAFVSCEIIIDNNNNSDLGIELFTVMDFDVPYVGYENNVALLRAPNIMQVNEDNLGGGLSCEVGGFGSVAYKAADTQDDGSIRDLLDDGSIDNWDDLGLPFGPGDFIGSFQYSLIIPPDGTERIISPFSVNKPLINPANIPTLSQWGMMTLLMIMLIFGVIYQKNFRFLLLQDKS